ncbi:MAG: hypothetical protein DRP66_01090 [Planctomycetota bacterium]|nr:MAG: hypothetical protein DRP66_01090 [Planctomycetota bacterium]
MILITMGAIMSIETFRAMVVREEAGRFVRGIETRPINDLPDDDLEEIDEKIDLMLKGLLSGRTVIGLEK